MAAFLGGYQARDYDVVDYHMAELPGTGIEFRGPFPESLEPGSYFAAIGAAQTLGCYCERPYPFLLAESIGLPALNLGWAGPGPEWFLRHEALLPYLNRARFVVMQVMSGRSVSNSRYDSGGLAYVTRRSDGAQMTTDEFFDDLMRGPAALRQLPLPGRVKRKIGNLAARPAAKALVGELRANYVEASLELLRRIEVPVVLFWFSTRTPGLSGKLRDAVEADGPVSPACHAGHDRADCAGGRGLRGMRDEPRQPPEALQPLHGRADRRSPGEPLLSLPRDARGRRALPEEDLPPIARGLIAAFRPTVVGCRRPRFVRADRVDKPADILQ